MINLLFFLLFDMQRLEGVIDRVEGDYAVVVWDDLSLSDIPLEMVRPSAREGESLCIEVRGSLDGPWEATGEVMTPTRASLRPLPAPALVVDGLRYELAVRSPCRAPIPSPLVLAGPFTPTGKTAPAHRRSSHQQRNDP